MELGIFYHDHPTGNSAYFAVDCYVTSLRDAQNREAMEDKMYHKFLLTTVLATFVALAAQAQSGGTGGSSGSGSGTGTGQGSTATGQAPSTSQTTPGPGNQSTITPGQGGVNTPGTSVVPGQNGQTRVIPPPVQNQVTPNLGVNTNQFNADTNRFGVNPSTNFFGMNTNGFLGGSNLAPTGRTNSSVFGTNFNPSLIPAIPR